MKSKVISFRLKIDELEILHECANEINYSITDFTRLAVKEYMKYYSHVKKQVEQATF